jgi:hypothetical protein
MRKDNQRSSERVEFAVEGPARCRFLLTDLAPGRWQASRLEGKEQTAFEVSAESGAGWFEGAAGAWSITPLSIQ